MKKVLVYLWFTPWFIVSMTLLAIVVTASIGFNTSVGIIYLFVCACRLAFIGGKSAGVIAIIVSCAVIVFMAENAVKDRSQDSLIVLYAKVTADLHKNNKEAASTYVPGAAQTSQLIRGVEEVEALHTEALEVVVDTAIASQVGQTGFSGGVENSQLFKAAQIVRKNIEDYKTVLRAGGLLNPEVTKPKSVDLTVDLTDSDGSTVTVLPGEKIEFSVKFAHYSIMPVFFTDPNGTTRTMSDNYVDANGMVIDDPDDRFVAPALPRYGTIYRVGDGLWKPLGMGVTIVEKNDSGAPIEVTFSVNDIKSSFNNSHTFDDNKGKLIIQLHESDIVEGYASAY